jgi:hypothetical protein
MAKAGQLTDLSQLLVRQAQKISRPVLFDHFSSSGLVCHPFDLLKGSLSDRQVFAV